MVYVVVGRAVVWGVGAAIVAAGLGVIWAAARMLLEGGPFSATLG